MKLTSSIDAGLRGAILLTLGQPRGILLIDIDQRGVNRSFWAIAFCLPAVVCLRMLDWIGGPLPAAPIHAMALHVVAFVVTWLLFAVLTHRLAPRLSRMALWPIMIAAWNWCSVTEHGLLLLGCLPGFFGAPPIVDQAAQVFTFGWALWVEWFAFRLAFGAGPLLAVWLVMVDQSIGMGVALLEALLTPGP